jgi:hypothetical protein
MAARCRQLISGTDLSLELQYKELFKFYHGDANIVPQVKMMILGMDIYEPMFIRKDVHRTGGSNESSMPLVMTSPFNAEDTDWVLQGNITTQILSYTNLKDVGSGPGSGPLLTGRCVFDYAQAEHRGAKKILSLVSEAVKEKILEKPVDGEYSYASGKSVQDLIHFIRLRMRNWNVFNGPSGATAKNNTTNDDPPHTANVLIEAVNELDWDTSSDKESTSEEIKLESYKIDYYPKGWLTFWLRGPLAPNKKDRLNILDLDDGSKETDQKKEKNSGRQNDRDNKKKMKDDERSTGAANGGGRGVGYRDRKDLALVAQQQKKQEQTDFVSKMAQITTVLKSLESTRESTMKMASEWRLGGEMGRWLQCMDKVADLEKAIEAKRNELEGLEQQTSDIASHVETFLTIGTDTRGTYSAKKPASAKKRKAVDLTEFDSFDSD